MIFALLHQPGCGVEDKACTLMEKGFDVVTGSPYLGCQIS